MTQDTNPTLTEDNLKIHRRNVKLNEYVLHFEGTIEECIKTKQQILTALQEYTELNAENEEIKTFYNDLLIQWKAQVKYTNKLQQENNQLKQLKQRIEDRLKKEELKDMSPECMGCEICYLKTELQQLLKDDTI